MGFNAAELEIARKLLVMEQFDIARAVQRKTGQSLLTVLLDMEMVEEKTAAETISKELSLPRFDFTKMKPEDEASLALDRTFAKNHNCFPVGFSHGQLILAMVDPLDEETISHAARASGYPVQPVVATHSELRELFRKNEAWEREELATQNGSTTSVGRRLPAPVIAFIGYPERSGKTFIMRNLAFQLSRWLRILLLEVGFSHHADSDNFDDLNYSDVLRFYDIDADLVHIPSIGYLPERLEELAERTDIDETADFELAMADIVETHIGEWGLMARWAQIIILIIEAERAIESCELIRSILNESDRQAPVSIGIVINKAASWEHGEASFTALRAALDFVDLPIQPNIWLASVLPLDPDAVSIARQVGRLVVDAFPRRPVSKGLRTLAKRILQELQDADVLH